MSSFQDLPLYCLSLTEYKKFPSAEIKVGSLILGANHPIRVQSMTTTDTLDIKHTVEESIRMIKVGCEIVRITVPSLKEVFAIEEIKKQLTEQGYNIPLVADIHFTPNAAIKSAQVIEKVRINPGNFTDKKKFENLSYTKDEYNKELARIKSKLIPLIEACKENDTALRIGVNHGSLSDRIMSYYGDTPKGMVASAIEFLNICKEENFHQVILSMKSSNPKVMVQAYRLLVATMRKMDMFYPLHLGVTEAGEGEDGRIKSAVGIGTLLADGLGDTIRVSLTEAPEEEIPVAYHLVKKYTNLKTDAISVIKHYPINPFEYKKRATTPTKNIGGDNVPIVMADFSLKKNVSKKDIEQIGWEYLEDLDKWSFSEQACDYVFLNHTLLNFSTHNNLGLIYSYSSWATVKQLPNAYPFFNKKEFLNPNYTHHPTLNFLYLLLEDLDDVVIKLLKNDKSIILIIDSYNTNAFAEQRRLFVELINLKIKTPVIISRAYKNLPIDHLQIEAASDIGGLLLDGLGDGVFIAAENCGADKEINQTGFGILQVTGDRISKTEYISCPSCGRTLFNLTETTAKIRAKTEHLKGLKIGIMGCIVNGPGEMADADYGYVGTGIGKITLYKKKEVIKRNVPESKAVEELINLIKYYDDWKEPETTTSQQ